MEKENGGKKRAITAEMGEAGDKETAVKTPLFRKTLEKSQGP